MDLFVNRTGEFMGPPLVFLHGGGMSGWMWDKQAQFFSDYHVIIPDLPGHGKSSGVPFISMNDAASKVLTAVMDAVGNERVNLVGFSIGAQLAVEIVSRWPEKVDSAVIASAAVRPRGFQKYLLAPFLRLSSGLAGDRRFAEWRAGRLNVPTEYVDRYCDDSLKLSRENIFRMLEACSEYALPESFPASGVRMLVLAGTRESGFVRASARDMIRANRNCTGYLVRGAGHGLPLAEPDFFNEIIFSFLNNIRMHRNRRLIRIV